MPAQRAEVTRSSRPAATPIDAGWPGQLLTTGESTYPRSLINLGNLAFASQALRLTFFTAQKSEAITQVRVLSGTTAAGATPTLVRMGIYDVAANGDISLNVATANDTSLLATLSTAYTKAFSSTWNKVAGQRYAFALLVVSGATMPTMVGYSPGGSLSTAINSEYGMAPRMSANVAAQADLPNSVVAGSLAVASHMMYAAFIP